ncbi:Histone-lysine N-methyltransferase H3 lysine-9 specific SUVH5 [Bienertia sinuspersici]
MEKLKFISEKPSPAFSDISSSGFGKSNQTTKSFASDTNFAHYTKDFPSNVKETAKNDAENKDMSRFHWRRRVGAVKSKLEDGEHCKTNMVKKPPIKMKLFRKRCEEICKNDDDHTRRIDLKVMAELRKEGKIKKGCSSIIGPVSGVEIGDRFRYRVELVIAGLHKHYERGIDYTFYGGRSIATCVIAMEAYCDKMNDPNMLTYIGEGGGKGCDQQLKGGNLALYESMKKKSVVRVVKGFRNDVYDGFRGRIISRSEYIYDGLYEVISCEKKNGFLRKVIFEFKLFRCHGQASVSWKGSKKIRI